MKLSHFFACCVLPKSSPISRSTAAKSLSSVAFFVHKKLEQNMVSVMIHYGCFCFDSRYCVIVFLFIFTLIAIACSNLPHLHEFRLLMHFPLLIGAHTFLLLPHTPVLSLLLFFFFSLLFFFLFLLFLLVVFSFGQMPVRRLRLCFLHARDAISASTKTHPSRMPNDRRTCSPTNL